MLGRVTLAGLAGLALGTGCASAGKEEPAATPADAPAPPSVDAPPPIDAMVDLCPSGITCQAASLLGSVSGDLGSDRLMTSGYQSTWIHVRVTENYSGLAGIALSLSATLTPPPGVQFGIFLYLNESQDLLECATQVGATTMNGTATTVEPIWGETSGDSNGQNDSRTVAIEIRHLSGTCAPDQMWQLQIVGNT